MSDKPTLIDDSPEARVKRVAAERDRYKAELAEAKALAEDGKRYRSLQDWTQFSIANGETSEGILRRAVINIASLNPLSTVSPQEIAQSALKAAAAIAARAKEK